MTSPPFDDDVPAVLEPLKSVVAATLDTKGALLHGNAGLVRLLERYEAAEEQDVGRLFRQPTFDALVEGENPDAWLLVHQGLITVGAPDGQDAGTSLQGTVHRKGSRLVLLAEHDPDQQEELRERMIELNEQLTETQREMQRELDARKQVEAQLEQKADDLERSNELLQEFAYVVSHDLQEPLRMVRSYLQLLEKRYEDQLDDEAQEFITYAVDGASRMREMIEGLLEYSRVQSRGRQPEPVDVNEVVDGVLENLHVAIQEADATVEVHDLGEALADEGQLGHVFQNLVSNALSHAGPSPHIEIGVEPAEEGFACFFVADDGAGIPEQEQADLFGIFHRGSNAAGEGTGIGLAVCQRIVDRHDGEIGVKSAPGEGAKFWFTLPTANAANSHTPTDRAPDSDPASTDPER